MTDLAAATLAEGFLMGNGRAGIRACTSLSRNGNRLLRICDSDGHAAIGRVSEILRIIERAGTANELWAACYVEGLMTPRNDAYSSPSVRPEYTWS